MNQLGPLLIAAMVSLIFAVGAAWLRHRNGVASGAVTLSALCMAGFLWAVYESLGWSGPGDSDFWFYAVVGACTPLLLSAFLLTAILGRDHPWESLRTRINPLMFLLAAGALFLINIKRTSFLVGFQSENGTDLLILGSWGKAYLSYLLIGAILVGYNLENTFRMAQGPAKSSLRPVVLGLFGVLAFAIFLLTTSLLYSSINISLLAAGSVPLMIASAFSAHGFLKGALTDAAVPVSRTVVYTSFTAFVAAVYILTVGLVAQVATYTRWSPGQAVTVSVALIVVASSMALFLSHRLQRQVRRFIDRNFYVNRYDYRSQWFQVTHSFEASNSQEDVLASASTLFSDVFRADHITITLFDKESQTYYPASGLGRDSQIVLGETSSPLIRQLKSDRRALILDRRTEDFEYMKIYVEDADWLEATASRIVAPLLTGDELLGFVGLARTEAENRFTYEDADLLDNMASHMAAVIRVMQLSQELTQSREQEMVSQWSNMLLHDLKNYISPLRMIRGNMELHKNNPDFQESVIHDLGQVTDNLDDLMNRLKDIRDGGRLVSEGETVSLHQIVISTVNRLNLDSGGVETHISSKGPDLVPGDAVLLRRVIENLVTNAVEAMGGEGRLDLSTRYTPRANGTHPRVVLTVRDTGPGLSPEFVRDGLFKPFSTTKDKGLGLGLYQSRNIIRSHRGEIRAESKPGEGTEFVVSLPAAETGEQSQENGLQEGGAVS